MTTFTAAQSQTKAPRRRLSYLKRRYVTSDDHAFVGRIYSLSIVAYNFDSYEEMAKYPDCLYALSVNELLSLMTRRIESLNVVADMLWLDDEFVQKPTLPINRFQWLNIAADAFLMRFVSIGDCALLLTNEVLELGLSPRKTSLQNVRKSAPDATHIISALADIQSVIEALRNERNTRFHRGWERQHTSDDTSFRATAAHENSGMEMTGTDQFGRQINNEKFFREGLVNLQRDFNRLCPQIIKAMDKLYDLLEVEFDVRFSPKFNDPVTGFGHRQFVIRNHSD